MTTPKTATKAEPKPKGVRSDDAEIVAMATIIRLTEDYLRKVNAACLPLTGDARARVKDWIDRRWSPNVIGEFTPEGGGETT